MVSPFFFHEIGPGIKTPFSSFIIYPSPSYPVEKSGYSPQKNTRPIPVGVPPTKI